jgi:PAS domain S-box-containing protein
MAVGEVGPEPAVVGAVGTSPALVLSALGDAIMAIDRAGVVIVWNRACERLFGFASAEMIGRKLPDLGIQLEMLPLGRELRLSLYRRAGDRFPAIVTATKMRGSEGDVAGLVILVKDLRTWIGASGEQTVESDVVAVEERLGAAFRGIVEAAGADLDRGGRLEPLAQSLAEQGRRLLPGISCLIVTVPGTRQEQFSCLAGAGPLAEPLVGRSVARIDSAIGQALAEDRIIESSDMERESALLELSAAPGRQTMRAVPMNTQQPLPDGRRALGAVAFFRAGESSFSRAERRLLDNFGTLVGISFQQAEFRAATERGMARLQIAVEVALDLARSLNVTEIVRRLVRRATVATRADRCALLRVEGGMTGDIVTVDAYDINGRESAVGYRRALRNQPAFIRNAVRDQVPETDGPLDPEVLEALPPALRLALADVRCSVTVPLVHGGEVVALLVLNRRRDMPFGPEEIGTLQLLGGPAALALRNSFLYQQTEEASRVKTDFLDMAAHELRTPLTVISGYLSILREGAFGATPHSWKEPLRILERKAAELGRLVDDLLLAARLETGRLLSVLEQVDLREVAEQVALAADDIPELALPEEPVLVRADREQLTRLVEHLVANALSYGRDGVAPWARLEVWACPDVGEARLRVEDRGRGMPDDAAERIFERFCRIDSTEHPMVPGTGLGLYIARELARRHRGRLELEWSQLDIGSSFGLAVPLVAP